MVFESPYSRFRGTDLVESMWDWLVFGYAFGDIFRTTCAGHYYEYLGGFSLADILKVPGLVERRLAIEVSSCHSRINTATECWIISSNI